MPVAVTEVKFNPDGAEGAGGGVNEYTLRLPWAAEFRLGITAPKV